MMICQSGVSSGVLSGIALGVADLPMRLPLPPVDSQGALHDSQEGAEEQVLRRTGGLTAAPA